MTEEVDEILDSGEEEYELYDLEAWDHGPLARVIIYVSQLISDRDLYAPQGWAADAWGNVVEMSSKQAARWSFSGALSKAATELFDPPDPKLEKDLASKYDFKVKKAKKIQNLRKWKARRYYGYAWGLFSRAADVVANKGLHFPIDHDTALKIVDYTRKELHRLIGVDDGSIPLGMARRTDLKSIAEIMLLEKIDEAGIDGYRLDTSNIKEVLASYDLYRRGLIIETETPWAYRRKHTRFASS